MNAATFFDKARAGRLLGPSLSQSEVDGCSAIMDAMAGAPLAWTAYAFATAYLETAHSMQPINEVGGEAYFFREYDHKGNRPSIARQLGNTQDGDGALYHGRGLVQLTGRGLYAKAGAKLGVDLVGNPSLALRADIAAKIMRQGMTDGWFTGKSFVSYLPTAGQGVVAQFVSARRIINGQDRAGDIASYAMAFQEYLA
jgi:putative chitinase